MKKKPTKAESEHMGRVRANGEGEGGMSELRILVCDKCFQRSCWEGIFMCWESQTAGLVMATKAQLARLNREHPSYYEEAFSKGGDDSTVEPLLKDKDVEKEAHQG